MNHLIIGNTQIRQDVAGRFCLNDLHQASGGAKRHQPANWLWLKQTQELVEEIKNSPEIPGAVPVIPGTAPGIEADEPVVVLQGGFVQGTYVVKELVYAYAMWISAAFHLHVIRAYDALVMERHEAPPVVPVSVTHRADVLVSATRTFAALTRVGRTLRMSHSRALAAANAATLRATGIDLVQEMEAGDLVTGGLKALPDGLPAQLAVWLEGRDEVTTHDIAVGIGLDAPDSIAVQQRIADAMRTLGWRKVRSARPERQWKWVR